MKKAVEIKGYWFLPGDPENRVAGILYYNPNEEIRLELIGTFKNPLEYLKSKTLKEPHEPNVIYGESSDARKISLVNCTKGRSSLNFSCSFPMQSYLAQYVLNGIYISHSYEQRFYKAILSLPYLTSWVNHYALDYSISYKEESLHGFQLGYDLDSSNILYAELNENIDLEIEYTCNTIDKFDENVAVTQSYILKFIAKVPLAFIDFVKLVYKFQNFLSMATLQDVDCKDFALYAPDLFQDLKSGKKIYHPVQLLFAQPKVEYKQLRAHEFLFDHQKISENFGHILKTWYGFKESMAPIMQHLIQSIQPKKSFSKADFLIVIQALEGFHTRFRNKSKVTLKDRLIALHQEFSFINAIALLEIDYKTAIDSRHYYSHFFHKSQKEHIADGLELYQLTTNLKKILICAVLKETGVEDQALANIMNGEKRIS